MENTNSDKIQTAKKLENLRSCREQKKSIKTNLEKAVSAMGLDGVGATNMMSDVSISEKPVSMTTWRGSENDDVIGFFPLLRQSL